MQNQFIAQGSTLNDVVIDLGTRKQEHIHCVGLSRVRKLENLFISSLNEQKIAVSENLKSGDVIAISESRLVPNDRDEDFLLPGFIYQLIETDIPLLIMGDTNIDFFTHRDLSSYLERLNVR